MLRVGGCRRLTLRAVLVQRRELRNLKGLSRYRNLYLQMAKRSLKSSELRPSNLQIIYFVRNLFIDQNLLTKKRQGLFNALVKPIFEYCCPVWGNTSDHLLFRILRVQDLCSK